MKTNPLKRGALIKDSKGRGVPTRKMMLTRARELAVVNGRSSHDTIESDFTQAETELTGRSDNPPKKLTTMKHNHNHDNTSSPGPKLVPVRFEFTHPTAKTVCLAGTFNHWQPEAKTLHSSGAGHWWKETNLAPGTYEYCLVVDDQWMADPLAKESVPNPFGGRNSVLHVASSVEAGHRSDASNLPLKNANEPKQKI